MKRMRQGLVIACVVLFTAGLAVADVPQTERAAIAKKIASEDKPDHQNRLDPESGEVNLVDAGGMAYWFNTSVVNNSSSASGAASEASFTTSVVATTTGGGTATTSLGDSFDGYGAITVNGTYYTDNGSASFECSGRQVVYPVQTIGSLEVSRKVFVPDNDEFARWINIIHNPTASPVAATLSYDNNLGSDGSTSMHDTSSGDTTWTAADTWFVTDGDNSDPKLGHIVQGTGMPATPVNSVSFTPGSDNPEWDYSANLPGGETIIIMHFVTNQPSIADAAAKAAEIVDAANYPNSLQCMTTLEKSQIVNWEQPVPVALQLVTVE